MSFGSSHSSIACGQMQTPELPFWSEPSPPEKRAAVAEDLGLEVLKLYSRTAADTVDSEGEPASG